MITAELEESKRPADYFDDILPPALTSLHLQNSCVVASREEILPHLPKGGICAEVGTQSGYFAKKILSVIQPRLLHLYDWDFNQFDRAPVQASIQEGVVELHKGDPSPRLGAMPDGHFDFIYLHTDHTYPNVARDLAIAALKLKEDGWLVCNDYTGFSPVEGKKYGVYRAVNEFCLNHDFEVMYLGLHPLGYHDVALRKRQDGHLGGGFLEAPDENTFMPDVWEYLISKYKLASVLDVGAGGGWSTKWFADRGLLALGVEGWKEALEKSQCPSLIIEHDYTQGKFVPAQPFDLAWCSEFVEHIDEQFIPHFMSTFQACKYVCLTHGEVGQAGYHHVNCQPTEYWISKMKEHGFAHDPQETAYLRSTNIHEAPWGRKTLTFFVNQST
jgi:SAM-dependent methyltransferase